MTQLGSPATESGPDEGGLPRAAHGSRLARRRRVLVGAGVAAALLAVGGLIGASFVKSPQQVAAEAAVPPATVTTAAVVSQVLTSSGQMRGMVYPSTQHDVYVSAPSSNSSSSPGAAGTSSAIASASTGASTGAVYISKLEVAVGDTIRNGMPRHPDRSAFSSRPVAAARLRPAARACLPGRGGRPARVG